MKVWVLTRNGAVYGAYRSLRRAMGAMMSPRNITWTVDVLIDERTQTLMGTESIVYGEESDTVDWSITQVEVTDGY